MATVEVRYKPANTSFDLRPGTGTEAMDAFLLSPRMARVTFQAAEEIAAGARALALAEAFKTGRYHDSIHAVPGEVIVIAGNPRVSAAVVANGGSYRNARNPETSIAAVVEWGNANAPARHILRRAGEPFDTEKMVS